MIKMGVAGIMFFAGLIFCFTIAGSIIGIPMILGAFAMGAAGFASVTKTTVKAGMATGKVIKTMRDGQETATMIDAEPQSAPVAAALSSAADEIYKLADLLKAGLITQEEFDQRKAVILAA